MNPSNKPKPHIHRTFHDVSKEEIADVERASILARLGWASSFGWGILLESKRILIISEAGAGKTYECRTQRQALWDQGQPAFYLDLAQLAANNLRDLLSTEEEARLDAWLAAQSDVATFFLDSIDELKLTLGSFETALKRLGKAVAGQLGRVRIVITTRPIAVDQQLIRQHFPVPDPVELIGSGDAFADVATGRQEKSSKQDVKVGPPAWRNVALMPLSDDQIREMAEIEGVDDADALLSDIKARNAEDFARRPQDLIELCSDWREHRRIRSHHEQVAHNIQVKLKPRAHPPESEQLTPDKALEGACRLALAMLLTRKLTIRLSVEADRGGDPGTALDPAWVLPDWTPKERETLLERALFGFASYGRVRFHHRSVVEFLAAQRLANRLSEGMPIKAVKRLLFVETPQGVKVIRPTMRPVAAWLASYQPTIFAETRDREPDALLNYADPASLSLSQRQDALRSYVTRFGKGGWRGLLVPQVQVHRFGSPDLEDVVRECWDDGVENEEVRELLLDLIGAGPMPGCAKIPYEVSIDAAASNAERLDAIIALAQLSDSRIDAITQSMVSTPALWPDALVRRSVVHLFPKHITPERLCEVLGRVPETPNTTDEIEWLLPRTISALSFDQGNLSTLRYGLTDLVTESLIWNDQWLHHVSKRSHLLPALATTCLRLIRAGDKSVEVLRSAVITLHVERRDHARENSLQELRKVLDDLEPALRASIFWANDTFNESLIPRMDPWERLFYASREGPLNLNPAQDGAWIRSALADVDRPLPERTMMLHALMGGGWDEGGDPRDHIKGLKQYVDDQPELIALIESRLAPREIDSKQAELEARIEQQRRDNEKRETEAHASWVAFWREVAEHPETAFSPDREGNTAWNLWQAMHRSGNDSRASGWNRRFIERHFGKDVADQLRTSMRTIWRKDRPTLRSERSQKDRETILIRWQLGLAAIAAEAEDTDWARKLTVEEAELAARYAPIELNGFPAWLEALTREHSVAVERILGAELAIELAEIAAANSFDILLQNVSHAPTAVAEVFLPILRKWLSGCTAEMREGEDEAATKRRLESVLEILLQYGDDKTRDHIRSMAEDYLKAASIGVFTEIWLATLMRIDPAAGTDAIERFFAQGSSSAGTSVAFLCNMFGDRGRSRVNLRSPGFTAKILLRLVRLAYQHVRPDEDIVREGVFSPNQRDEAQAARNALLTAILNTKGAEAWAVKLEMTDDALFNHFRDRLVFITREKAAEEADSAVFTETDVVALDRYGEAPPTTREDMFQLLVDRLDDLDDLLLQDVSPRAAWNSLKDERVMRQQIALQLQNSSRHVYSVDQEAVTADEKETDIRLRVASSDQQGTIELKVGESWSGRELRDTIKNQLVTKYMAAEKCRSGCLLVTVASERKWDHPDTGESLDIGGLRAMLEEEARKIVVEMGCCLQLAIKVLDLRPRLASESKSKPKVS